MIAEKEAQAAGPIIEDLESKVEHTLKTVQQHKKETEQVKQKLVQSDAEKNRIKNDLIKANAQIQTLMKRQAS
jgi:septal ring factor EnvC (AmiA/AmiB activator)